MRLWLPFIVVAVLTSSTTLAVDRWIPIAGTVNNFRTDARVWNPSQTKDIEIKAYFLRAGATNNNEVISGAGTIITLPKRQMRVLDDVVATLFSTTGLGAILFTSPDEFVATSRIYAQVETGTLGQFSTGVGPGTAFTAGVIMQLESTQSFRTNIGAVNPANATNVVTWRLYDKNSALIATGTTTLAAYEVIGPTNLVSGFFGAVPAGADLSDAWIRYTATNPLFAYASVIDNGTTDPTFILMSQDTGGAAP